MKLMLSLIFSGMFFITSGQIQKGDFLIRGGGASINNTGFVASASNIDFNIDLGYFVSDRWMAGAGLDLSLSEFSSLIGNKLFGRYYFKDTIQNKRLFYVESRYESGKFAPIGVGQSNRRFRTHAGVLACGLDFFISRHLAIETHLDYYFLDYIKGFNNDGRIRPGFLSFEIKLQYFFRYRDFRKERLIDYRTALEKGTWFLGGRVDVLDQNQARFRTSQNFAPLLGRFVRKNWAVGTSINYSATSQYTSMSFGLGPFSRYYFNVGRKKKIFAELNSQYTLELEKGRKVYEKNHLLNYGIALGWSNFIDKDVSFDIIYSIFQDYRYNRDFSEGGKVNTRKGLSFVIQYYF